MELNNIDVSDDLLKEYEDSKSTGFANWKKIEYERFLTTFENRAEYERGEDGQESWNIDDCELFAKEINGNYHLK